MKVRILNTSGHGSFSEASYDCPEAIDNGIIVKNIMTGVCTSDLAMMQGEFGPLPLNMQGHEGLGQVTNIGSNVRTDIEIGDFVATRGEPAYADYYPVRDGEFVRVPEAEPKYILEPVACGINIITGNEQELLARQRTNAKLLILGTGFLAYVAYKTLKLKNFEFEIDVVGKSNQDIWQRESVTLMLMPDKQYDVVINLKDQHAWLEQQDLINNNGLLIDAVGRTISKRESENLLWKAVTTVRPSPRTSGFLDCMLQAVKWIKFNELVVDDFWSQGYNRDTNWQQAFEDGINRPKFYSRGYIYWTNNGN